MLKVAWFLTLIAICRAATIATTSDYVTVGDDYSTTIADGVATTNADGVATTDDNATTIVDEVTTTDNNTTIAAGVTTTDNNVTTIAEGVTTTDDNATTHVTDYDDAWNSTRTEETTIITTMDTNQNDSSVNFTATATTMIPLSTLPTNIRANKFMWNASALVTKAPKYQCGTRMMREGRIVGGKDAFEGEFPWTVSVRLLTTHFCGGAIISNRWILTAAHCVKRYSARYFRIRMGEDNVNVEESRPDIDAHVEEINVHPEFGKPRRYSNDLAVLKLKRPLVFNAFTLPVCLPSESARDLVGRNATVVGWGWLNEVDKGKSKAKRLQKVQVPVLNNSLCEEWYSEDYKGYVQIHDYQICAGYKEGGRDSCQGDSGGPLVMMDGNRYTIIGVVSAGVGCARRHMPGIYSRVSSFVPWIRNVTGIQ